jgi:hypothetical protein
VTGVLKGLSYSGLARSMSYGFRSFVHIHSTLLQTLGFVPTIRLICTNLLPSDLDSYSIIVLLMIISNVELSIQEFRTEPLEDVFVLLSGIRFVESTGVASL